LVNDQRDAQFFSMFLSLFLTLDMFRAHRAYHQERQFVSIHPLVTATKGCIDTNCLSWWWARCVRNM